MRKLVKSRNERWAGHVARMGSLSISLDDESDAAILHTHALKEYHRCEREPQVKGF
jgi:hypothetical protein